MSDTIGRKALPEAIKNSIGLCVGWISGASREAEYEQYLSLAGYQDILIADSGADLNEYLDASSEESAEADGCRRCSGSMSAYASCNDILQHQLTNLNEWIIQVFQDFHHESDGQWLVSLGKSAQIHKL